MCFVFVVYYSAKGLAETTDSRFKFAIVQVYISLCFRK